jgi:hypothetical protein
MEAVMKFTLIAGPAVLAFALASSLVPAAAQETAPLVPLTAAGAEPTIEAVVAATERFKDVNVALAEGYIRDPMNICETAEMLGRPAELGVMGVHYFRPDLLGITATEPRVAGTGTHTDMSSPGVLIYEPQADGTLRLVAIEGLVFRGPWEAAGNTAPPSFEGNEYVSMIDDPATPVDEAHGFEPHYELHLWLYRDNPNGAYTPFNPSVTCDHAPMPAAQG